MSPARGLIVILFGLALGGWLLVATLRSRPVVPSAAGSPSRLQLLDRLARLVLSVSAILLALFLGAGRMLWTTVTASGTTTVIEPTWANIVGALSLIGFIVSGIVVLGFKALHRQIGA